MRSVTGSEVIIDKGKSHGIYVGDIVTFRSPGLAPIQGTVSDVSSESSRVEIPSGASLPKIGAQAQIEFDDDDTRADQESEWDPSQPLLAPSGSEPNLDDAAVLSGHVYSRLTLSHDRGSSRENDFYLGTIGVRGEITNLYREDGRLNFSVRSDLRSFDSSFGQDDTDFDFRVDRFSYSMGNTQRSEYRIEVGRFYSHHLPELGLIDGVEGSVPLNSTLTIGGGAGLLPVPFPIRKDGDAFGGHVFVEYQSEDPGFLSAIIGYQRTYHHGDPDRDLVAGRITTKPHDDLWFSSSFKVDIYNSDDTLKGSGIELTELFLQAQYRPNYQNGITLSYARRKWPDLKRREFSPSDLINGIVRRGRVDKVQARGWHEINDSIRLSGGAHLWEDQDNDGGGVEAGIDVLGIGEWGTSVYSSIFYTSGVFHEGPGLSIEARQPISDVQLTVGYELAEYEQAQLDAPDQDSFRHTARAALDWGNGPWTYYTNVDFHFGDGEKAMVLNVYVDYRF